MSDGLRAKYIVQKAETGEAVEDCFVLRPEKDPAAIAAIRAYAAATNNPALSADLLRWVGPLPNDPLTLDELREMDGEPVWLERPGYGKRWVLVQAWGEETDIAYFTYNNGLSSFVSAVLDCGGKAYRRKPDEV